MSRGLPSLTALLGLVAVAGYQNRDKLAELFGGGSHAPADGTVPPQTGPGQQADAGQQGGLGGMLGSLGSLFGGGANAASTVNGGLGGLLDQFKQNGHGDVADSWIGTGPNKELAPEQLETAIGPDVLATLTQQTGLSREELLARLGKNLPSAVDQYTPDGRLPA